MQSIREIVEDYNSVSPDITPKYICLHPDDPRLDEARTLSKLKVLTSSIQHYGSHTLSSRNPDVDFRQDKLALNYRQVKND